MNLLNILSAAGAQNQGFQAQQQQQRELQAQQIAAQRLAALISQQSQGPGFQAMQPGSNAGAPQMGGMQSPQGGPVPLPGASDGPQPGGDGMRAQLAQLFGGGNGAPPMGSPQITPFNAQPAEPTGDPFSMPKVANAVFGPGGGQTATDFLAFQDIEKTMRPYGQIQGRQALENTRQVGREDLESQRQQGRMDLQKDRDNLYTTHWSQDREERAREADQRSSDTKLSITQRQQAAQDSIHYKQSALEEKAREADRQSEDKRLSIAQRQQAAQDAAAYRQASLEERAKEANSKAIQGEEKLKIQRQNADTSSDRAGTYKLSTMERGQLGRDKLEFAKSALQQKNAVIMRGQDKNYTARMASVAARATPAQKAELDTATKEFAQASMNYRNAKISMNSTPDDIDKLADVAIAAQKKMEDVTAKIAGGQSAPAAGGAPPAAQPAPGGKAKIKQGEEVRYDDQGNAFVNRNGQAVPAEQ